MASGSSRMAASLLCVLMFVLAGAGLGLWGCGTDDPQDSATQTAATQATTLPPAGAASGADEAVTAETAVSLVSTETRVEPSPEATAQIPTLVAGNSAFALDLFNVVRSTTDAAGGNLVFSPYSLSLTLAMTYAGARGETEKQMAEALHFELPQDALHTTFNALDLAVMASDTGKLTTTASAWVFPPVLDPAADVPIRLEYLDLLARNYGAALYRAPADTEQARQIINAWTEEKTEGLITDILPPGSLPDEWTALVLANAMYLGAAWTYTFPAEQTRPAPFYRDDGTTVEVPMMVHNMVYGHAEDAVWAAVDLPCAGSAGGQSPRLSRGDISAVFLLPKEGSLDQAVAATTAESLQALVRDIPDEHLIVRLPRFGFDAGIKLKDSLIALGMIDAFDPDRADLGGAFGPVEGSGESHPGGIWVDEVYHGGVIAVDENGIEAAAGSMVVTVAGIGPGEITFDRPFLFLIRHVPTGTILFLGQVTDPAAPAGGE
jgi:serpin B